MALRGDDLKRILTTEERNALVIVSNAHGADDLRIAARRLSLDPDRLKDIVARAREKIERESRKGGGGVTTVIESVVCGCSIEFTPRRKGELQCPSCRELNGDGRPLTEPTGRSQVSRPETYGREEAREPAQESAQESAHSNGNGLPPHAQARAMADAEARQAEEMGERIEASENGTGDHGDVARNPPPARPFPTVADVAERREGIITALAECGGEATAGQLKAETGIDSSTFGNDANALVREGRIVKIVTAPRRAIYRTPGYEAERARAQDTGATDATAERRERILDYIGEHGRVATMTLSRRHPSVTYQTIQNDLHRLHADGKLVKIRGGALIEWRIAVGEDGEPPYFEDPAPTEGLTDAERAAADRAVLIEEAEAAAAESKHQETLDVGDDAATPEAPDAPPSFIHPENETPEPGVEPPAIDVLRQRAADTARQLMAEAERLAEAADAAIPETLLRARYIAALLGRIEAGDTSPDLLDRFERVAFE